MRRHIDTRHPTSDFRLSTSGEPSGVGRRTSPLSTFWPFSLSALLRLNWVLILSTCCLLAVGVLFINSASAWREDAVRWIYLEQLMKWIPLGVVAHVIVAAVPYRRWLELASMPYLGTLLLLVLVLIPGIGTKIFGARRWLFGIQPSEFAKIAVVLMLAQILSCRVTERGLARFVVAGAVAAVPILLIVLQPDLGTAIVLLPTLAVMVFVSGCALRALGALALSGVVIGGLVVGLILGPEIVPMPERTHSRIVAVTDAFIYPHWKKRVLTFAFPDRDPLGAGWTKRMSEIAVGSGGFKGKGYLNGTQNSLGFLPRAISSTDFIFSVIAEEAGFVGSAALLSLYVLLFGSIFMTAFLCVDTGGRLLCAGVGVLLFVHVFINIAMTIGKMPITGIPLPLVSYGGSFTISTLAMLGLVQSVAVHSRKLRVK